MLISKLLEDINHEKSSTSDHPTVHINFYFHWLGKHQSYIRYTRVHTQDPPAGV